MDDPTAVEEQQRKRRRLDSALRMNTAIDFVKWCYPDIEENNIEIQNISGKAILAPTNRDVDYLNQLALDCMSSNIQLHDIQSADSVLCKNSENIWLIMSGVM